VSQNQNLPAETPVPAPSSLLSDKDLAKILVMTIVWVRAHASEIPGFKRLGSYFRFSSSAIENWLGSLDPLFVAEQAAQILNVAPSWVYANADDISGILRLGRYVRFRPALIRQFLTGAEVVL
jgi:predicted DNA-binding transcriptional regulator AlpA